MSFEIVSSSAIIYKAGAGATSSLIASGAAMATISDQAQGRFCRLTNRDWINDGSDTTTMLAVKDAVAAMAAFEIVNNDGAGYLTRAEQQTILNGLYDEFTKLVAELKDKNQQQFN